jgi:hypothetical protein
MRNEVILSVNGRWIGTQSGQKIAIGNQPHAIGDIVSVDGMYVFGHQAVYTSVPYVPSSGYHFADSGLNMIYVNAAFNAIIKTTTITPPNSSANLLLHCYNKNAEYLVWMIASTTSNGFCDCIIQKDGNTIADFTSAFTSVPSLTDAYIDANNNLIWVAMESTYLNGVQTLIMVKYTNGTLTASESYTFAAMLAAMQDRLISILSEAAAAVVVIFANENTTVTTQLYACLPDTIYGMLHESEYIGVTSSSAGLYSNESNYISGIWALDAILGGTAGGSLMLQAQISNTYLDTTTGEIKNIGSSPIASLFPGASLEWFYKASGTLVAEKLTPNSNPLSATVLQAVTSVQAPIEKTSDGIVSGSVTAVNSASSLSISTSLPANTEWLFSNPTDMTGFVVTFTACNRASIANLGQSRTLSGGYDQYLNGTPFTVTFSSAWDAVPVVGDTFTIAVAFATATTTIIEKDITMTVGLETFQSGTSGEFDNDIGSGYTIVHSTPTLTDDGSFGPVIPSLKYGGATIFTGSQGDYLTNGAWMTDSGKLVGLYEDKVIKSTNGIATSNTNNLFSATVTKRFVQK